ncbi:hypothetical protein FACS1894211_02920 [Clostridia bacterium]|nr:hypothetical protein FACS1894211_02920 [Clostridia bacterium]
MKFILYLLMCIGDAFGALVGATIESVKTALIGWATIAIVIGLYVLFVFLLNKTSLTHIKVFLFSFLIVLAVVALFCGVSILAGLFIK